MVIIRLQKQMEEHKIQPLSLKTKGTESIILSPLLTKQILEEIVCLENVTEIAMFRPSRKTKTYACRLTLKSCDSFNV